MNSGKGLPGVIGKNRPNTPETRCGLRTAPDQHFGPFFEYDVHFVG
jgi:hypothetical protein